MDEGTFFVSRLPKRVKSIPEAFDVLMPSQVKTAILRGQEVHRQGEWFFIKQVNGKEAKTIYKTMRPGFILPVEQGGNRHKATRGYIKNSRIFVSGQLDHPEHSRLSLSLAKSPIIFRAYENMATANFSSTGVD